MSHTTTIRSVPIRSVTALRRAVERLARTGIKISIEENARPRNYYEDQYRRTLNRDSEIADIVLRLSDAFYDIGLLKDADGSYSVNFDPIGFGSKGGSKAIKDVLGVKPAEGEKLTPAHGVGQLLAAYTLEATCEVAEMQGLTLQDYSTDAKGNLVAVFA